MESDPGFSTPDGYWSDQSEAEELQDYDPDADEALWERLHSGECFRGGEATAFNAEQQAWIQRNLK